MASTQSASESFHYGQQLDRKDRDPRLLEHNVELPSPKENQASSLVANDVLTLSGSRTDLVLKLEQNLEASDKERCVGEGVGIQDHGQSDLLEQFMKRQGERELIDLFEEDKLLSMGCEDAIETQIKGLCLTDQGNTEVVLDEPQALTEPEELKPLMSCLLPNQDAKQELLKQSAAETSDVFLSRSTDPFAHKLENQVQMQENGFHDDGNVDHAEELQCQKINLASLLHQEAKEEQKDQRNGELFHSVSENESSIQSKKELVKSPFVARQSRIPVLAQEIDSSSDSSPVSAKEKLFLKKAHQTDLVRLLVEKRQLRSFLGDLSSASDKSLKEKVVVSPMPLSEDVLSSISNLTLDSHLHSQVEESFLSPNSAQSRKSKIPRPVSWTATDHVGNSNSAQFFPRPPPGRPPTRPGVEAR